jgi:hypothetical protein
VKPFTAELEAGRTPKARLTLPDSALKPSTNRAAVRRPAYRASPGTRGHGEGDAQMAEYYRAQKDRFTVNSPVRDEPSRGPRPRGFGDRLDDESRQIGHPPGIGPQDSPEAFAKAVLDMGNPGQAN